MDEKNVFFIAVALCIVAREWKHYQVIEYTVQYWNFRNFFVLLAKSPRCSYYLDIPYAISGGDSTDATKNADAAKGIITGKELKERASMIVWEFPRDGYKYV